MKKSYMMPEIKEVMLTEDNHLLCGSNEKSEADVKSDQFEDDWK